MFKEKGFSLIEILVAVAVIGVLLAVAVPSLSSFLSNSRVRAVASEIRDGLQGARMEALRCNKTVTFNSTGAAWSYTDCASNSRSRPSQSKDSSLTITWGSSNPVAVSTGANSKDISFNSTGRASAGSGQFNISATGTDFKMRVMINAGGMVRSCNPDAATGASEKC